MDLRPRRSALLPVLIVAAVALALWTLRPHHTAESGAAPAAGSTPAGVAPTIARSPARMLAEDPLHVLVSEPGRVQVEHERFISGLARAHATEARDPDWGPAAEAALHALASSPAMATTGLAPDRWSSDCRSRTCRVTADFANHDAAQDWANFFLTGTGGTLAGAELSIQRTADHATRVLIFGARP